MSDQCRPRCQTPRGGLPSIEDARRCRHALFPSRPSRSNHAALCKGAADSRPSAVGVAPASSPPPPRSIPIPAPMPPAGPSGAARVLPRVPSPPSDSPRHDPFLGVHARGLLLTNSSNASAAAAAVAGLRPWASPSPTSPGGALASPMPPAAPRATPNFWEQARVTCSTPQSSSPQVSLHSAPARRLGPSPDRDRSDLI